MIRTIILDDEKIIRKGIQKIIRENLPELEVTASLQNGRECLEYLEISGADLIISDIRMPYVDGLELLKTLRNRGQQTDVFQMCIRDRLCCAPARRACITGCQKWYTLNERDCLIYDINRSQTISFLN